MTTNQYLNAILSQQRLSQSQFDELKAKRNEIKKHITDNLTGVNCTIKWAGSWAKDTMIADSYDVDIVVYVHSDENAIGDTLEKIFDSILTTLNLKYTTLAKTSAIRILDFENKSYTHVDVVPGRYFDEDFGDSWLHRTTGDKTRLKTNLDVHVSAIRDSGLKPLVRLMKLWAARSGLKCPTFILELLVIQDAAAMVELGLSDQVVATLKRFRDENDTLKVVDPANPNGNDLSESLNQAKTLIKFYAGVALDNIESDNWEAVFGEVNSSEDQKRLTISSAVSSIQPSTKPWLRV